MRQTDAAVFLRNRRPGPAKFRDALPKTIIGKLSKKELKAEEIARDKASRK